MPPPAFVSTSAPGSDGARTHADGLAAGNDLALPGNEHSRR